MGGVERGHDSLAREVIVELVFPVVAVNIRRIDVGAVLVNNRSAN